MLAPRSSGELLDGLVHMSACFPLHDAVDLDRAPFFRVHVDVREFAAGRDVDLFEQPLRCEMRDGLLATDGQPAARTSKKTPPPEHPGEGQSRQGAEREEEEGGNSEQSRLTLA
jgi:hypothetical protein